MFVERLVFGQLAVAHPVIINVPSLKRDSSTFGNWRRGKQTTAVRNLVINNSMNNSGEPSKINAECVALDFNNDTLGQWFVNACVGQLLCSKKAKPGATHAPSMQPSGAGNATETLETLQPSQQSSEPNFPDNQPETPSDSNESQADAAISSMATLAFMFVLAILIICFVIIFAWRLRKRAQMISLQANQFDSQLYCDKRPERDQNDQDLILFEKGLLKKQ